MKRAGVTVAAALLLGFVALALLLSKSPATVTGASSSSYAPLAIVKRLSVCQAGESLPRGTSALRLGVNAFAGPRTTVAVLSHGAVVDRGERGSGWTGGTVTIPIGRLANALNDATLCYRVFNEAHETLYLNGEQAPIVAAAHGASGALPGRLHVEYLTSDGPSWWSLVSEVSWRMGIGHGPSGEWNVVLAVVLMSGLMLVCSYAVVRGMR